MTNVIPEPPGHPSIYYLLYWHIYQPQHSNIDYIIFLDRHLIYALYFCIFHMSVICALVVLAAIELAELPDSELVQLPDLAAQPAEIAPEPLPLIHPPHELLVSAYELFFSLFSHFQRVIACFLAQIICLDASRFGSL